MKVHGQSNMQNRSENSTVLLISKLYRAFHDLIKSKSLPSQGMYPHIKLLKTWFQFF
jgi:hypothetical protein